MALIRNAKPKNKSGAYNRLFDNHELGHLISRVHSTVISSGTELEKSITSIVNDVADLDAFLEQEIMPEGVFLVRKNQMKKSKTLNLSGGVPDFIIFRRRDNQQRCHIVELKDGHSFDTKKVEGEKQAMLRFIENNAQHLPYVIISHFCSFNQGDRAKIVEGFKNKIEPNEAMTGRELCELLELEIDYDKIVDHRLKEGADNLDYFCSELVKIEAVRTRLESHLKPSPGEKP